MSRQQQEQHWELWGAANNLASGLGEIFHSGRFARDGQRNSLKIYFGNIWWKYKED